MALLTLDEAKAALNITGTAQDDELQDYLDAVTDMIESRIGPVEPRTVTSRVDRYSRMLPVLPVLSVQSLVGQTSGTTVAATITADPLSGVLSCAGWTWGSEAYTATYTAGRIPVAPRIL